MTESESKLKRVKALLLKAARTEFEPEADALRAKAYELMAQYGIEEAMLEASGQREAKLISKEFKIEEAYSQRKALLLQGLAGAMRCKSIRYVSSRNRSHSRVMVYGYESDIERLSLLFTTLLLQLNTDVFNAAVPYWESKKTFRTNFIQGWKDKVVLRVKAAEATEASVSAPQGSGAELMLFDRQKAVESFYNKAHPVVGNASLKTGASGYGAGAQAGARARIGGTSVGGSGRRAIA
jgi:hypothetical protein